MKNLNKNSVANVAKVGVASALIGAGLFLSACGGDSTSKAEKFVKEKYPDAKILSFSEIQKEFGIKDKECLKKEKKFAGKKGVTITYAYIFVEENGKFEILEVMTNSENGESKIGTTYSNDNAMNNFEYFKTQNAECFN